VGACRWWLVLYCTDPSEEGKGTNVSVSMSCVKACHDWGGSGCGYTDVGFSLVEDDWFLSKWSWQDTLEQEQRANMVSKSFSDTSMFLEHARQLLY